jgi:hypothetical protein
MVLAGVISCSSHIHTIGSGPQGLEQIQDRQWYALCGIVPITEVDTQKLAGDISDYEIKTEVTILDTFLNLFTMFGTVTSRTVTVTK